MGSYGYLFPGQGSQKIGMGKNIYDTNETARKVYNRAESALDDISMKSLCFEADEEALRRTENTQPALYTVSYAIYTVLMEAGFTGEVFAGHSLGEYTAVAAAGYLEFEDGLRIVRKRGLLMKDCDPERKGGMAAVIGIEQPAIEEVCKETGDVYIANFNSPNQIVISGLREKVEIAAEKLKARGAKRTVVLNVGGPFHSPYMKEAAEELAKELEAIGWKEGKGKIMSNATAGIADTPETIKKNLILQLSSPVLWSTSLQNLVDLGYTRYIEAGPGKVLQGLFRSINNTVKVFSVERAEDLDGLDTVQ
jgi:[acyl-carrier-protein] S-malonyltransferase